MSVHGEHTRPLEELRRADEARFGGKSAALGELIGAGIDVPEGFGLSASAFEAFVEEAGLAPRIAAALEGLDPSDVGALRAASAELVQAIGTAPVPDAIRAEIAERYSSLGEAAPVAVRSSAIGEDSEDATFAGQQETFLWVRGPDRVADAVRDCWASLYGPEAIGYRARLADAGAPAMGVTVQSMVDAEVSGVMFTCNPVNGDPSTIAIDASWGLGLAVVAGEVTPDEFRLNKVTGEVTHRSIGPKQVEYRPDPDGAGTVRLEVESDRRESPCLDEDGFAALLEAAKRIEAHFGSHQDVEWAIPRGESRPRVLQSRPVTTGRRQPKGEGERRSAIAMVMSRFGADVEGRGEG